MVTFCNFFSFLEDAVQLHALQWDVFLQKDGTLLLEEQENFGVYTSNLITAKQTIVNFLQVQNSPYCFSSDIRKEKLAC